MKKLILITILVGLMAAPALAARTIEFSPGGASPGNWHYDGSGTFDFPQDVTVDKGLGNPGDLLVDALVYMPDLDVLGIPGGPYSLDPVGAGTLTIKSSDNTKTYLIGTLGLGVLTPGGTAALSYYNFQADIKGIHTVTADGQALGSNALDYIHSSGLDMDFDLTFQGASQNFVTMLEDGIEDSDGFSASAQVIPAPGAILLGGIGVCLVGWLRRRRTL